MKNQFGRAGSTAIIGALLTLAGTAGATAQSSRSESTLLGVTLLKNTYRDVLRRFGRPDEIQAGGPFVPEEGAPANKAPASGGGTSGMMGGMMGGGMMKPPGGMMSGGMMGGGMMGGAGGGGGGKKATSKNGFPGKGGTGTAGPGGGNPGMSGMMSGGMMGGPPGMSSGGGGLPGFGGMMGGPPGMGGASSGEGSSMPGMGGSGMGGTGGADASAEQPEYEATWWYHDKVNGLHKSFLFNKDGRVIQVQEYGYDKNHKGSRTRLGVGLGSGLNQVLHTYGWSNDGANDGRNLVMRFGGEHQVAFQLVNNRVVGITVAVVKHNIMTADAQ